MPGLFYFVTSAEEMDWLACFVLSKQVFFLTPSVFGDNGISCGENGSRGTVVLFEKYRLCSGESYFEIQKMFNISASPAINVLVNVTNYANISMWPR